MRRNGVLLLLVPILVSVIVGWAVVAAQHLFTGNSAPAPRWATTGDFDGSILFCRGHYANTEQPVGIGWWVDYPGADHNFMVRLAELSEVQVRFDAARIPFYVTVRLDDPLLFKCPVLFMSDVGALELSNAEVRTLRTYVRKGGLIWVDDFWGSAAWDQWENQIARVTSAPIIDVPADHPILHQVYSIPGGIWQQPHVAFWYGYGSIDDPYDDSLATRGRTSELGEDSQTPHLRAILDDRDRISVLMTHNTDIADGWEEEKPEWAEYTLEFSVRSYAFGVNVVVYSLSH